MSETKKERCETCRFWDHIEDDDGLCKRYPPCLANSHEQQKENIAIVGKSLGIFAGCFPRTWFGEWCGEWQAIPLPMAPQPTANAAVNSDFPSVYDIDRLSVRLLNRLNCAGIKTVEQLLNYGEEDLLAIKQFGKSCLQELRSHLAALGLKLKGD